MIVKLIVVFYWDGAPLDIIVAIDGDPIPTWQELEIGISLSPNQDLVLEVERQGQVLTKEITTSVREGFEIGTIGVGPFIPYIISDVESGSPAAEAGLRPGDEIVRLTMGNKTTVGFDESAQMINASEGSPLRFEVLRDNQVFETTFAAVQMEDLWRIGTAVDNVCFILKADVQVKVMKGSLRPKADIQVNYYKHQLSSVSGHS